MTTEQGRDPVKAPPPEGVWLAYHSDLSGVVPFATELEALRYAIDFSMSVRFVRFGDEDWLNRPREASR